MCAGFAGMWVVHKAQRVAVTAFGARIPYCAILIVRLVVVRLPLNSLALTSPLWPRRLQGRGGGFRTAWALNDVLNGVRLPVIRFASESGRTHSHPVCENRTGP